MFLQEGQNLNFKELKILKIANFKEFSTELVATIIYNYGFINIVMHVQIMHRCS